MKTTPTYFVLIYLFSVLQVHSQINDSTLNVKVNSLVEKAEFCIKNKEPEKAICFLDQIEKAENVQNDKRNFTCGNGAITAYLERLIIRTKAYNLMGKYNMTIDTLLPLMFNEEVFSLNIRSGNVEDICSILIESLERKYTKSEIKEKLKKGITKIELGEVESLESHKIIVFKRELRLYFTGVLKAQRYNNKQWSDFYNNEFTKLTEEEAELRKREIEAKIENYVREIYEEEILGSLLYSRVFN